MTMGESVSLGTIEGFGSAFDKCRLALPARLQEQIRMQVAKMDMQNILAELKSYKEDRFSLEDRKLLVGVLCLLGYKRKPLEKGGWQAIKNQLGRHMVEQMLEFELESIEISELERRWASSMRATALGNDGRLYLDMDHIMTKAAVPLQMLCKWLVVMRLVMQVIIRRAKEKDSSHAPSGPDSSAVDPEEDKDEGERSLVELLDAAGDV